MPVAIDAHERTIGALFSDSYAFEIPAYQRLYAWEVEQARDFLPDFLEGMKNSEANRGVYFLGSAVLIKSPVSSAAGRRLRHAVPAAGRHRRCHRPQ